MSRTDTALWDITEDYLGAERVELDDLEVRGSGRARTVKVTVDGEGLDLDRISEISRGLSRLFDAEYATEEPYQLEVTSPGLERALKRPRHFQKSLDREVVLKVRDEAGKAATHRGTLVEANEERVVVDSEGGQFIYPYDAIISARTVFRWEASPKPGK